MSGAFEQPQTRFTAADWAVARLASCEARKPTDADRPPPSVLPMTPAAREALRLRRERDAPLRETGRL